MHLFLWDLRRIFTKSILMWCSTILLFVIALYFDKPLTNQSELIFFHVCTIVSVGLIFQGRLVNEELRLGILNVFLTAKSGQDVFLVRFFSITLVCLACTLISVLPYFIKGQFAGLDLALLLLFTLELVSVLGSSILAVAVLIRDEANYMNASIFVVLGLVLLALAKKHAYAGFFPLVCLLAPLSLHNFFGYAISAGLSLFCPLYCQKLYKKWITIGIATK